MRAWKGLEKHIDVSVVHPLMLEHGWELREDFPGATGDPLPLELGWQPPAQESAVLLGLDLVDQHDRVLGVLRVGHRAALHGLGVVVGDVGRVVAGVQRTCAHGHAIAVLIVGDLVHIDLERVQRDQHRGIAGVEFLRPVGLTHLPAGDVAAILPHAEAVGEPGGHLGHGGGLRRLEARRAGQHRRTQGRAHPWRPPHGFPLSGAAMGRSSRPSTWAGPTTRSSSGVPSRAASHSTNPRPNATPAAPAP